MREHLTKSYHKCFVALPYNISNDISFFNVNQNCEILNEIEVSAAVHMLYVNMSLMQTRTTDGVLLKHSGAFLNITDQSSQFNTETP